MKKILCLILALMMCACMFVGCTKDKNEDGEKKTLVCGVTIIPGLNEKDANGNWTGFESEFAMEVGKILGMEVKFQEIEWSQKYNELNSGAIDCVWNGFTANSSDKDPSGTLVDRSTLVDFSYGYMLNQQCIVVKSANVANFPNEAALMGKSAAVEGGSAGDTYASTATNGEISRAQVQIEALSEVKAGAVDFAVVDIILAKNVCGKANYSDLAIVEAIQLPSEIYAVGFKKGSDLTAKVNAAIKQLEENGKLMELAQKYGFENVLQVTENIK